MRLTRTALVPLLAAVALGVVAGPAQALPPTERTLSDTVDPTAAYDVTAVTLRAAARAGRPAVVVVKHARAVRPGDALDVWFDLDDDQVPDLHLGGAAFSEYAVHEASSFTRDGRDISGRDCVRLSMSGRVSKVRLYPDCVGQPLSFAVAVRSSVSGKPVASADWAPEDETFSKRVLAQPLS